MEACSWCGHAFGAREKPDAIADVLLCDGEAQRHRYCSDECTDEHIGVTITKNIVKRVKQLNPKLTGSAGLRKKGLVTRITLTLKRIKFRGIVWSVRVEVSIMIRTDLKIKTRLSILLSLNNSALPAYELRTALLTDPLTLGTVMEDVRVVQKSRNDDDDDDDDDNDDDEDESDELQTHTIYLLVGEVIERVMEIAVKSKWLSYPLRASVRADNEDAVDSLQFLGFRCEKGECAATGAIPMILKSASKWWDTPLEHEPLILESIGKSLTATEANVRQQRFSIRIASYRKRRGSKRRRRSKKRRRMRSTIGEEVRSCCSCRKERPPAVYCAPGDSSEVHVCDSEV